MIYHFRGGLVAPLSDRPGCMSELSHAETSRQAEARRAHVLEPCLRKPSDSDHFMPQPSHGIDVSHDRFLLPHKDPLR